MTVMATSPSTPKTLDLSFADVPEHEIVELDVLVEDLTRNGPSPLADFLASIAARLRDGHDLTVLFD